MKCVKERSLEEIMLWWNEEVKDTVARKKAAFKELCKFPLEDDEA